MVRCTWESNFGECVDWGPDLRNVEMCPIYCTCWKTCYCTINGANGNTCYAGFWFGFPSLLSLFQTFRSTKNMASERAGGKKGSLGKSSFPRCIFRSRFTIWTPGTGYLLLSVNGYNCSHHFLNQKSQSPFFLFAGQCIWTWMWGIFGQKCQNWLKLPHWSTSTLQYIALQCKCGKLVYVIAEVE